MNSTLTQIGVSSAPVDVPRPNIFAADRESGLMGGRIRSNLVWMVVGTVWSGFCQWSLLIVLAKFGTVDMVGTFTLGLAIAFPVLMFSCLNLRNLYVTDCACAFRFREYLALRLAMGTASVAFVVGLAIGAASRDI